jgi:hypothetical protein
MNKNKIFVLGDSRTGTLSVSNFFSALGFKSIHYYQKEAQQLPYSLENRSQNYKNILSFIRQSKAQCFSDYPTRLYYKELTMDFPDSYFVLTYRKNLEVWKKSMLGFFGKFNMAIDIEMLSKYYLSINQEIIEYFRDNAQLNFLTICIDDGSVINSAKIKEFLKIDSSIVMTKDNQTVNVNNEIPSGRYHLMEFDNGDPVTQIEAYRRGSKGLLSEYGWIYLINDSNAFMQYLFGRNRWGDVELARAGGVFKDRLEILSSFGSKYFKFIIPEKSVIYREYLPKALNNLVISKDRPAIRIRDILFPVVSYLDNYLIDAKSYGFLYFRGDSHVNWLGAYFIYQYIIKHVNNNSGGALGQVIPFSKLLPVLAGYDGDLSTQIAPEEMVILNGQWKDLQSNGIYEHLIRYDLPIEIRRSFDVKHCGALSQFDFSREIIVREVDDDLLPSAVIFRDSTSDFIIDLMSEHFRRSVFVWHKGEVIKEVIEIEKPDYVIHVMAERFVVAYGHSVQSVSSAELGPIKISDIS